MANDEFKSRLLKKSWEELFQLRCDQYCSKEEIVDDILKHDDGSVREMVEMEGSFLQIWKDEWWGKKEAPSILTEKNERGS